MQKPRDIMTICDIWEANFSYFSEQKPCSPPEHDPLKPCSPHELDVHHMNEPCSCGELKKEQIEERTKKESMDVQTGKPKSPDSQRISIVGEDEATLAGVCNVTVSSAERFSRRASRQAQTFSKVVVFDSRQKRISANTHLPLAHLQSLPRLYRFRDF